MRPPFRTLLRALPIAIAATFVAPLAVPSSAQAQSVDQQRQKVDDIVDELERLEEKANRLAEDYIVAIDTKDQLDAEIIAAEARLAEKEVELDELRSDLSEMARRSFVGSGSTPLGPLFDDSGDVNDAVKRDQLARAALSAGDVTTDELNALLDDIVDERADLDRKRTQAEQLAESLIAAKQDTEAKSAEYTKARADAEAKLGALIQQEEQRRADESARRLAAQAASQRASSNATASSGNTGGSGGSGNAGSGNSGSGNAGSDSSGGSGGGGGASASVPNVSSRSGIAIQAAMAQQGVPYRFASSIPGVAFDCSGLTAYAWGKAGVGLPHQSRAQYATVPHVPKDQAQPGDLLFFYSPISHVSIYLGNGTQVHAPSTGKTVSVAAVNWGKVVGVGRPG